MGASRKDPGTALAVTLLILVYGNWVHGISGSYDTVQEALKLASPKRSIEGFPSDVTLKTTIGPISEEAQAGIRVYEENCIGCHGTHGNGNGPAGILLSPKPRDFTSGKLKFVTSASSTMPRRADIMKTVTEGLPGSSMPSFRLLPERDRQAVSAYIEHLIADARFWNAQKQLVKEALEESDEDEPFNEASYAEIFEEEADVLAPHPARPIFPRESEPDLDVNGLAKGRSLFQANCASCHGPDGRGTHMADAENPLQSQRDDFGEPSRPRNLSAGVFRHGGDALSIWYRISRGLDGAVMPKTSSVSSKEAWHIAHFVQLLYSQERQKRFLDSYLDFQRWNLAGALKSKTELEALQATSEKAIAIRQERLEEAASRIEAAKAALARHQKGGAK